MLKFIIRRILWTIPVILLVILMTFSMMKLIKGNPFRTTDRPVPPAIQANLERQFNLDKPWYLQYAYYVKGVFTFDLGPSLIQRNRDVNDVIKATFPVSLKLGGLAMLFAIVVGIPLGIIAALKQNTPIDYAAMAVVNAGYALPNFLIATLLIYFFAVKWRDQTGIGRYFVTSVAGRDYSVTMGITVLLSVIIIVANLVVDILYGYLDPRIRDART